jgi:uncharacterized protein
VRCPVCDDVSLIISSREGVEIDHCPQCRGVWLDRGELDKIIDRAAPSVVGADRSTGEPPSGFPEPPRYDDRDRPRYDDRDRSRYDDRDSYKRRKRRSFLEEIFDFD